MRWPGSRQDRRSTRSAPSACRRACTRRRATSRCSSRRRRQLTAPERFAVAASSPVCTATRRSRITSPRGSSRAADPSACREAVAAAVAAAAANGPYGRYPDGPLSRENKAGPRYRAAPNPPSARPAPRRGVRARAPAGVPPARCRAGRPAGAARRRLVDDRHRDPLPARRLPVLPDPGRRRIAHPGRPPLTREVPA